MASIEDRRSERPEKLAGSVSRPGRSAAQQELCPKVRRCEVHRDH